MPKKAKSSADYILPLNINGLSGRMLYAPSKKRGRNRHILVVYGHHAKLERWTSLVENLQEYGNVTMADMPGFGGMESFGKIGLKPSIDNFADYLAAFIKLRYKNKRLTIFAISFGFVVATRMLQRYPELVKKVDIMVSVAGFTSAEDFIFKPSRLQLYRYIARFLAARPVSFMVRYVGLNRFVISTLTKSLPHSKHKHVEVKAADFQRAMDFEVVLWQANDVRTHWLTTAEFLKLDNRLTRVNLPVYHLMSEFDQYFNEVVVESNMRRVFADYTAFKTKGHAHVPSVIADKKEMAGLLPPGLRRVLRRTI